ncbi:STAS/SEC14 domain-containing protein [Rufibacter sp. LB8]|uniref:STAS/SEC14 domain-containing protein n=1 Tax=Rufibacter sp. LB8 TaxID=2777781 RepID=UPI00178C63D5|nr:STAS/SEC14 domain-containing protein [Rufibacter sp. LB8]
MEDAAQYLQLETDWRHLLLVMHWQGFVPSEAYRAGMLEAIQVADQEHLNTWVMDMKGMKVIRQADQDWTLTSWFAQFQLVRVKRLAFVVSDDIFNQMAVSSMVATMRPKMQAEVEYFQSLESALRWAKESASGSGNSGLFSVE